MPLNAPFVGHGIWLELSPLKGLKRYANYKTPLPPNPTPAALVDKFIEAVTDMKMSSVWFELFTRSGEIDNNRTKGTRQLVDGLKAARIATAPWGYCYGKNSERAKPQDNDLALIQRLCDKYKLDIFCANIEPWNESPKGKFDAWIKEALGGLLKGLNTHFGKDSLGISSFGNLSGQPKTREYLVPFTPLVSFCAPQIYWNSRQPVDWVTKCLQSWRDAGVVTELIATTQSYWSKHDGTPARGSMEKKVQDFVTEFPDIEYAKIVGLNWYHAGGPNSDKEGGCRNR